MFRVGQNVVCVDDGNSHVKPSRRSPLRKGEIYKISDIFEFDGLLHLQVRGFNPYFSQKRFRPIVERKTDISIFTEMLNPAPKHEVANG